MISDTKNLWINIFRLLASADYMDRQMKMLLYSNNLWFFGQGMLGPLFAIFAKNIGGNILQMSWAWAAYLIVMGFGIMVVGKISNRENGVKEKLLFSGHALGALFTFSYLMVSTPFHLFLVPGRHRSGQRPDNTALVRSIRQKQQQQTTRQL